MGAYISAVTMEIMTYVGYVSLYDYNHSSTVDPAADVRNSPHVEVMGKSDDVQDGSREGDEGGGEPGDENRCDSSLELHTPSHSREAPPGEHDAEHGDEHDGGEE